MLCYKKQFSAGKRKYDSESIIAKYPDRIPIIIQCDNKELASLIKKRKFLVPNDIQASYLLSIIRNRIKISSSKAMFMFHENRLIQSTQMLGQLYDSYIKNSNKLEDKFLYITLQYENTFG